MKKIFLLITIFFCTQSGKSQKLFELVEKKNSAKIKEYLKHDISDKDIFQTKTGKSGDSSVNFTFSILEWAAVKDCKECVDAIVSNESTLKGKLDVKKELNKCVSHAVRNNNESLFDYLLAKGANINTLCQSCHGQSPVQLSLVYGNYNLFYKLLKLGATTDEINIRNQNLIHVLFLNYEDARMYPDTKGQFSVPAVEVAKDVLDTLLKRGVNVNDLNSDNMPAWMLSALTNQPVFYDAVKKHKAPYDKSDMYKVCRMIGYSIYYPDGDNVNYNNMMDKILKEEGIQLTTDMIDKSNFYSGEELWITYAADLANENVFEQLMKYSPNIESVDSKGYTAMMYALENENEKICGLLLDAGLKVSEKEYKFAAKVFKSNKELVEKFKKAQTK